MPLVSPSWCTPQLSWCTARMANQQPKAFTTQQGEFRQKVEVELAHPVVNKGAGEGVQ